MKNLWEELQTWIIVETGINLQLEKHTVIFGMINNEKCRFVNWLTINIHPIMSLNIVSTNISFPLGKMTGMVRSRTSFIMSSQSWEIGSPPTGGAGRMK